MKADVQALIQKFASLRFAMNGLLQTRSQETAYSFYYQASGALFALLEVKAITSIEERALTDYFNQLHGNALKVIREAA